MCCSNLNLIPPFSPFPCSNPPRAISLLHQSAPHIPLILFVRPADKACAIGCLHAGAENYMLEGFIDVPTLDHVLHAAIQRDAPSALNAPCQPHLHSVTKLPNRSGLLQRLLQPSQESVLSGSRLLISIHLTNLKYLQSSAGHTAVARALRHIAHQLQSLARRSDLLAYVAPGVFAFVIFDANESCLASLQSRIDCRLLQLIQCDPSGLPLNFSVKTSSWTPSSSFSFQQALTGQLSGKKSLSLLSHASSRNSNRHRVSRCGQ
jgi:GGDEF domain-containing protein